MENFDLFIIISESTDSNMEKWNLESVFRQKTESSRLYLESTFECGDEQIAYVESV